MSRDARRHGLKGLNRRRSIAVLAALLGFGCASRPVAPPLTDEPPEVGTPVDAATSAADARLEGPADDGPGSDASVVSDGGRVSQATLLVADEPVYPPGGRRRSGGARPEGDGGARAGVDDEATLARWNVGGSSKAVPGTASEPVKPPHPAPRIKIEVVSVRGRMDEAELLRQVRSKGYWPLRQCYEAGLLRMQKLSGTARVRLTVDRRGRVREPKRVRAEIADEQVVTCIVQAFGALTLLAAPRGAPEILLEVALYPGDEPVVARTSSAALASDPVSVTRTLRDTWPALRRCYEDGLARDPELWGRLAVRMRVTTRGTVIEATEVESRFPDPAVTNCVCRVLGQLDGLAMRDGTTFVYALRFGNPPVDGGR